MTQLVENTAAILYYIISGRIPFDDEDSTYIIAANSAEEAVLLFETRIYADQSRKDMQAVFDDNAETVYINNIVVSETPVQELSLTDSPFKDFLKNPSERHLSAPNSGEPLIQKYKVDVGRVGFYRGDEIVVEAKSIFEARNKALNAGSNMDFIGGEYHAEYFIESIKAVKEDK